MRFLLARVLLALVVLGGLGLAGCGLYSKAPLSDDATTVRADGLLGRWRLVAAAREGAGETVGPEQIVVGRHPSDEKALEAVVTRIDEEGRAVVERGRVLPTRIGLRAYLSAQGEGSPEWWLAAYERIGHDRVRLVGFHHDLVREAVAAGALRGRVLPRGEEEDRREVHLDATTAALRAWLEKGGVDALDWGRAQVYLRTEAPPGEADGGRPGGRAVFPVPDAFRAAREVDRTLREHSVRLRAFAWTPTGARLELEAEHPGSLGAARVGLTENRYLRARFRGPCRTVEIAPSTLTAEAARAMVEVALWGAPGSPDLLAEGGELSAEAVAAAIGPGEFSVQVVSEEEVERLEALGCQVVSRAFELGVREPPLTRAALHAALSRLASLEGVCVTQLEWVLAPAGEGPADALASHRVELSVVRALDP